MSAGRGAVGLALALAAGVAALSWATAGFRALTLDGARAAAVAATPRALPAVRTARADGTPAPLVPPGDVAIVDFVSTRCQAVCLAQGAAAQQLQDTLAARPPRDGAARVRIVTVSFDPDDDAARLAGYAAARRIDATWWSLLTVASADRRALLDTFGIVVVRDPIAGWRHNAAWHVVARDGRLTRIVPADAPLAALRVADSLAEGGTR